MTGKTDMVSVSNLPSHLSQPSRRAKKAEKIPTDFVPISAKGQREIFTAKSCAFEAKQAEEKGDFQHHRISHPLPAVLPPVGRFVASQCGGGVRIPPCPFGSVSGALFGAPKAKQEKRVASCAPPPRPLLPTVRAVAGFHHRRRGAAFSAGGGVENRKSPAVAEQLAGSQQNFKEENESDK